jgi:hypothetical protein
MTCDTLTLAQLRLFDQAVFARAETSDLPQELARHCPNCGHLVFYHVRLDRFPPHVHGCLLCNAECPR